MARDNLGCQIGVPPGYFCLHAVEPPFCVRAALESIEFSDQEAGTDGMIGFFYQ
jgi:hypothetical protein